MKVLLLTGSHPRHYYIVNKLKERGLVAAHLIEQREEFVPQPPENLQEQDKANFIRHFSEREVAEAKHFGEVYKELEDTPSYKVNLAELNSLETHEWIQQQEFDLAISYGVHKLDEETLNVLGDNAWNIHGGLSPWYKGNITLFWPFMMLKPNWAGMTVHKLTNNLDGGDIVHHSVPKLSYGDGIHDVACNAVKAVAEDLVEILTRCDLDSIIYEPQMSNGKLWVGSDWMPQHLRFIYDVYDNKIVDNYLDKKLENMNPKLFIKNLKR